MSATPSAGRRVVRYLGWGAAAVVVLSVVALSGVVFAWARFAHTLPDLHGWHIDAPKSEFRATDATDAYTFDDYLKQEAKVFAELDELVKTKWAGEKPGKFCRFKADSICNPRTILEQDWNRTYVLE